MNWLGEKRFEDTDNGPRVAWMVSYADMMTIILTFMILLLSISTIAQTKYEVIVEEFTGERIGNLHDVQDAIDDIVDEAALGGEVETALDDDGLTIEFSNALLFPTGSAELREEAKPVFDPIRDHLSGELDARYGLIIEGYTDDVPISTGRFESNWELASARAIHVKRLLEEAGLDRRRLAIKGYADTRPAGDVDLLDPTAIAELSDEQLAEIRSANRRVVIRVDTLDPQRVEHLLTTPTDGIDPVEFPDEMDVDTDDERPHDSAGDATGPFDLLEVP